MPQSPLWVRLCMGAIPRGAAVLWNWSFGRRLFRAETGYLCRLEIWSEVVVETKRWSKVWPVDAACRAFFMQSDGRWGRLCLAVQPIQIVLSCAVFFGMEPVALTLLIVGGPDCTFQRGRVAMVSGGG